MTALAPLGPEAVAEAVEIFKTLLRFPTINPPGGEKPAIDWIADLLRREGIEPVVLESAPGRANLVARLKGGSAPALLLTGHVDVVPVERDKWTADPFGAEERDGWIYGRGAVDMKHHVAMSIAVFLAAHRRKLPLARDLVLCVVADEEAGCNYGMKWLVEEHGDLLKAGWGLNEFGGFNIHLPGGREAYLVQIAERGYCWFKLRATGLPGHGSLPPIDSAVARIARAIDRLDRTRLPWRMTEPGRRYLSELARVMGPAGIVPRLLMNRATEPLALKLFPNPEQANSIAAALHNTAVPTVLHGGEKTNLLPGTVEVEVDGRYLPGVSEAEFLAEVRAVVGDDLEIEVMSSAPPAATNPDTPFYRHISGVLGAASGKPVIPWMLTGFSDSKWLDKLGVQVYGCTPLKLPPGVAFQRLPHGHDERLPRAGYEWGVDVMWQIVGQFASRGDES